jgi:hypothetical protein
VQQDEDGFFGMPSGVLAIGLLLAVGGFLFLTLKVSDARGPAAPSTRLFGCYSSKGGPDIEISETELRVLQTPPVVTKSALNYMKGWKFEIPQRLNLVTKLDGTFAIEPVDGTGQFLIISRELEVASRIPGFNLFDRKSHRTVRYEKTGDVCEVAPI